MGVSARTVSGRPALSVRRCLGGGCGGVGDGDDVCPFLIRVVVVEEVRSSIVDDDDDNDDDDEDGNSAPSPSST